MSPRRAQPESHYFLLTQIEGVVQELRQMDDREASLRNRVRNLTLLRRLVNDYGASLIPDAVSAQERILAYLRRHVGEIIDSEELVAVSGIQEAPRRIRELRERGYRIVSGVSDGYEHLGSDQYILLTSEPDRDNNRR